MNVFVFFHDISTIFQLNSSLTELDLQAGAPRNISYGLQIAGEVMAAVNVTSLEELRNVPAEKAGNR